MIVLKYDTNFPCMPVLEEWAGRDKATKCASDRAARYGGKGEDLNPWNSWCVQKLRFNQHTMDFVYESKLLL